MKNKEFWKDTIYEFFCEEGFVAFDKWAQEPKLCSRVKCERCLFRGNCIDGLKKWLEQEHIEPVLDDVEKRYLEAVLMPFKKRVLYVVKFILNNSCKAYLEIRIKSISGENSQESLLLPYFDYAKMYTGMEKNKNYTIEELGLFADEEK